MAALLRPPGEEGWRVRPRDGSPRCILEQLLQQVWRWRVELMLAYLVAAVSLSIIYQVRP